MNTLELILQIFSLILEVFLGLFVLSRIMGFKQLPFRSPLLFGYFILYAFLLLGEEYWVTTFVKDAYPIYLLLHSVLLILYSVLFCEGRSVFGVFLPLTFVSFLTLHRFPSGLIRWHIWEFFGLPALPSAFTKLFNILFLLLITLFMLHFRLKTSNSYPFSYYVTMVVTPVLNMTTITLLKNYYVVVPHIDLIGSFTLLIELLIYYMIWQSTTEYGQRSQLELMEQQHRYQLQHMTELKNIVTDYHQLRHDMKNHFACMDRLISQEKYPALKEYFYSLSKEIYALDNQIESGNEIVNQVLNIKYSAARSQQIPMEIHAVLPKKLNIPDHHLCSVLANLLDNAIEASVQVENRRIEVKLEIVKSYLSLTVKNKIRAEQKETAKSRRTTKSNPRLHGLGLQIVEDIVRQYNGISTFEVQDLVYVASVMLELPS